MSQVATTLSLIDQLGLILDQIEQLSEQAEDLKNQIKLMGAGTTAGDLYVSIVKLTTEKRSTSWASVAKELNAPQALIDKHTKISRDILSIEVKALNK